MVGMGGTGVAETDLQEMNISLEPLKRKDSPYSL